MFEYSKKNFIARTPRFYILKSDHDSDLLVKFKHNYSIYCEDSWFMTPIKELNLNYKAKIDVRIKISNNKKEIIDCIMNGFSTHDPNDPYGDLSPTYRKSLESKLFDSKAKYKTYHYVAEHDGKVVSIAGMTIKDNNAYLNNVTTLKNFKVNGVSKEILSCVVKDLKDEHIQNIIFATETGAYTETYYKNLGFKVVDYGFCFEERD